MKYTLFNLVIDSDIPLPLLCDSSDNSSADLVFQEGVVPKRLAAPLHEGPFYQIADQEFLLDLRDVARFWGSNGRLVVFERADSACDENIALFLLGTVLGILLQQQGIFLLHASAVVRDAGAILIAGDSGAGKSTLTAAMVREGYRLIADDTCMLTLESGRAIVHPGHPHIRLWSDSLDLLGISTNTLARVHTELDKFHWQVGDSFAVEPQPVDAFFELIAGQDSEPVTTRLVGIEKILALTRNTFRVEALDYVGSYADSVAYWAARAKCFPLFRMVRPMLKRSPDGVLCGIESIMTTLKEIAP